MFKAVNRGTQKFDVLEYLNRFPNATNKEIAEALNIPLNSARGRKSELDKEGFLDTEKEKGKTIRAVATEKAKTQFPELTDDDFARDDFIDRDFDDDDTGIWYKKILKTGKTSNPRWKTSTNIEAITFEKNDKIRFDKMLQAIQNQIPEISYIDEAGYDQNSTTEFMVDEEAQYPRIKVNLTSGGTTSSEFVIAD